MKCTKIMLSGLVAFAATANAMPTQEETKKVESLVMDLMRDDQAALKSGKKTRVEVAESAMELADKAESEAAKLLLIKGAFNLYVRAGEFDKAIETLQTMQTAIPDMPPANMVNIIEAALRVVSRKNGGQLYRLLDETKTRMRYTNEAASLEKSVKRSPADRTLRTRLAEHYAYLGKWDMALENFAATDGKVGAIAKSERDGKAATEKVADFWWNYPTGKADELVKCFRIHAAKLYEDAIAADDIKGLNKVQAERRIEEAKGYGECVFNGAVTRAGKDALQRELTFELGRVLDVVQKLEMVKCPAGKFMFGTHGKMGLVFDNREVCITRPFYMATVTVTKGHCACFPKRKDAVEKELIAGNRDKLCDGMWMSRFQAEDYLNWLNGKFKGQVPKGYVFRLPTLAEFMYALSAGESEKGTDYDFTNFGSGKIDNKQRIRQLKRKN